MASPSIFAAMKKPTLYTSLSPALLHLYDVRECIVVVIDVLRATSTIATALHNEAKEVIPVDSVEKCIRLGKEMACITAGERKACSMAILPSNIPRNLSREKFSCSRPQTERNCFTVRWLKEQQK
jgi:hypothetical protein